MTPAERTRKWQQENREAYLESRRAHYRAGAAQISEAQRARELEVRKIADRAYYARNRDRLLAAQRAGREAAKS